VIAQVAPPFRTVEFDILFGSGIDKLGCLLDAADQFGVVERKGSWYSRGDLRFAQGRRPAIDFLRTNEAIAREVEADVRKAIAAKAAAIPAAGPFGVEEGDEEDAGAKEFAGSEDEY
jgi:recombination protein RecA